MKACRLYNAFSCEKSKKQQGFTLIELTIAMAVAAILAAVAFPMYTSFAQKSRRADAKAALMAVSQQLERYYTQKNTYATATLGGDTGIYPAISQNGYYTLSLPVANLSTTAYKIFATPIGVQADDACGTFTLDEQSTQGVSGGSVTDANQCW